MANVKKTPKKSTKVVGATRAKRAPRAKKNTPQVAIVSAINRLYRKSASMLIFEALLFVVVAAVLFVRPVLILTIFTYVVGLALILFGMYRMICGFTYGGDVGGGGIDVVFGLISLFWRAGKGR